jgi:hypothetical protein
MQSAIIMLLLSFFCGNSPKGSSIVSMREAIIQQMKRYPKSTLQDFYKNFFQDNFGPGHLVTDSLAADRYLKEELNSMPVGTNDSIEVLGWKHQYCRVPLSLIKDGHVAYNVYMRAFLHSATVKPSMSVKEWSKEWKKIEGVIEGMRLHLPDYEKDKEAIRQLLKRGEYVSHHSRIFDAEYHPHYRLMTREIYEKEILPYLKGK